MTTTFLAAALCSAAFAGAPPESLWTASDVDFQAASDARFASPRVETPEKIEIRLSPGAWLDGSFVLSRGQPAIMCLLMKGKGKYKDDLAELERQDRASRRGKQPAYRLLFEFDLPEGVSMVDVADGEILSCERTPSGTHCKCVMIADFDMGLSRIPDDFNWWRRLGFLVSADTPVQAEAKAYVTWDGRRLSNVETVRLRMIEPVRAAARPKKFRFGVSTGGIYPNFHKDGWRKWTAFCREAGLNTMTPDIRDVEKRDWQVETLREVGFSWVLPIPPPDAPLSDGYRIGPSEGRPESDRFVTEPGEYAKQPEAGRRRLDGAVCPSAVYERRPFFMTNTLPRFASVFAKADGVWCNWEPFLYMGRGCFCDVCRRKFAEFAGVDEAALRAEWPKAVMRKGRLEDAFVKFSSREHGRMLRVVNEEIDKLFMGGRRGFGFMPGVAWCEMASMWRGSDYAKSVRPFEYAADFEWIGPWGPYAIWPSQQPYEYSKWRNLRTFLAAKDVREQVDADYPLPRRPKLMAYPHGLQGPDWLIRPEALEMNIDAFFFNGWESVVVYHFPKGYDQRWWAAIARCAEKQAKYEDVVLGGGRRDDSRVVLELAAPYAAPNSVEGTATRGLEIRKPMLQHVAWEKGGRTVVAVFNFWEKAPAFFRMRLDGRDAGEFVCGALRTAVFEFGAGGERLGGPSGAEVAEWRLALTPRLEAAKALDDAFERKVGGKDDAAQALERKMYQPGKGGAAF